MVPGPEDHDCGWKQRALELEDKLSAVVGQLEALNRQVFGKKSEKMPPMDREVRKKRPPDPAVTQERRVARHPRGDQRRPARGSR